MRAALALLAVVSAVPAAAAPDTFQARIEQAKTAMLAAPERAIALAESARPQVAKAPSAPERLARQATIDWLMGEGAIRLGDPQRGLDLLHRARREVDASLPGTQLEADLLLSLGGALTDTGDITEALATLQRAHVLFQSLNQPRNQAKALILIALLYDRARDHAGALRYFDRASGATGTDPGLSMAIHSGRGVALCAMGQHAAAVDEFARALTIARAMKSNVASAQLLANMADAQLRLGQPAAAEQSVERGLALATDPAMTVIRQVLIATRANIALRRGDVGQARSLIAARFDGVDLRRTLLADRDAHEIAYRVYMAAHDDAAALPHLIALKRLDDQATEIARSNSAALASARFDYANQELRIAQLKADDLSRTVAFERSTAQTERTFFVLAALAALLVVSLLAAGLLLLRRSRDAVRAANDGLEATNSELAKALRIKTEFLATTSHEIRTPLNGILGMTQVMIADATLNEVTRDRLSVVHGAGVTMRALVDDILDVAKIETGRMTIEMAPIDLRTVLQEAAQLWRDPAAAKGLSFRVVMDEVPGWVLGDEARLRQIVFNLLSNAVKFTGAGHVALSVATSAGRLRLTVADSGIGIAPAAHEMIFESFRQADAGTTRRFGGTGLGLAICRSLARAMGGDVTVRSEEGGGATFMLDLPLVLADAPEAIVAAAPVAVLVVEDNPIRRAMFASLLSPLGRVAFADPADAAADAARIAPARVLLDHGAHPSVDVAALVAAAGPAPVMALHARGDHGAHAQLIREGATQVVEKPVEKSELVRLVGALSSRLALAAA
ncbi:MAG: ATP-binding protein [Sphingomonas adhaesiva]|uniref:ATP-binding protein n=1 Tax=Sphingomonas adhaesiva TaxID=28212 RepID=UPI002FF4577C